jgi:4-hydroxy-tetrahydrodipicolinate synthase
MSETNKKFAMSGVFAAALTPLDDTLEPDPAGLVAHAEWLLSNGCDGVALLGTTGEANSFSLEQRLAIVEAATALPRGQVMIGTGCAALTDSVRLTKAALAAGFNHVLMLPPFYYKNLPDDGVFRAFAETIERVGDGSLRIYLYHFPQMSAVPISLDVIGRLLSAYPDTIAGLKDSSGDWDNTSTILREFPDLATFAGTERYLLDNLRAGGPGCISATTNVSAPMAQAVHAAWRADDAAEADARQQALTAARLAIQAYPAIPALKYLTSRRTGKSGWLNLLPPLIDLDNARRDSLVAELGELGFFDAVPQMQAKAA